VGVKKITNQNTSAAAASLRPSQTQENQYDKNDLTGCDGRVHNVIDELQRDVNRPNSRPTDAQGGDVLFGVMSRRLQQPDPETNSLRRSDEDALLAGFCRRHEAF
jgi:hypothetical protein